MILEEEYRDLKFTAEQLMFTSAQTLEIADELWGAGNLRESDITNRDRAFVQAAIIIAADKSYESSQLWEVLKSFISANPSQSLKVLVRKLATATARRWFSNWITEEPKINAVGISSVQRTFDTEWELRKQLNSDSQLHNFLIQRGLP